jgi:hypothetical protein
VIPQASSAAAVHGGAAAQPAAVTASGFPAFVHLPADQAAHPSATNEWWYTIGHLFSHGHAYSYEVQLISSGVAELSITDVTAGKYYTRQVAYKPGQFSVSATRLDVRMPDARLSGPMNAMHHVYKVSSTDSILADETTVSAQPDNTGIFRQVDGKYIYNLALSGYDVGRYEAVMRIGGNASSNDVLSSPGYFGLR